MGEGDEEEQPGAAGEGLHEHDGTLADAVGERAGDRGADGVGDGEPAGRGAAEAVGAGRPGDEEEGAHLAHREGQAPDERDEDVEGAGEREQAPVAGDR